jgi:hypothetical protein
VIGVNNDTQKPLGCINITFKVNRLTVNQTFRVFTKLNCNIILGLDFLEDKHAKIDLGLHTLSLYDGLTVCQLSQPQCNMITVFLQEQYPVLTSQHSVNVIYQ